MPTNRRVVLSILSLLMVLSVSLGDVFPLHERSLLDSYRYTSIEARGPQEDPVNEKKLGSRWRWGPKDTRIRGALYLGRSSGQEHKDDAEVIIGILTDIILFNRKYLMANDYGITDRVVAPRNLRVVLHTCLESELIATGEAGIVATKAQSLKKNLEALDIPGTRLDVIGNDSNIHGAFFLAPLGGSMEVFVGLLVTAKPTEGRLIEELHAYGIEEAQNPTHAPYVILRKIYESELKESKNAGISEKNAEYMYSHLNSLEPGTLWQVDWSWDLRVYGVIFLGWVEDPCAVDPDTDIIPDSSAYVAVVASEDLWNVQSLEASKFNIKGNVEVDLKLILRTSKEFNLQPQNVEIKPLLEVGMSPEDAGCLLEALLTLKQPGSRWEVDGNEDPNVHGAIFLAPSKNEGYVQVGLLVTTALPNNVPRINTRRYVHDVIEKAEHPLRIEWKLFQDSLLIRSNKANLSPREAIYLHKLIEPKVIGTVWRPEGLRDSNVLGMIYLRKSQNPGVVYVALVTYERVSCYQYLLARKYGITFFKEQSRGTTVEVPLKLTLWAVREDELAPLEDNSWLEAKISISQGDQMYDNLEKLKVPGSLWEVKGSGGSKKVIFLHTGLEEGHVYVGAATPKKDSKVADGCRFGLPDDLAVRLEHMDESILQLPTSTPTGPKGRTIESGTIPREAEDLWNLLWSLEKPQKSRRMISSVPVLKAAPNPSGDSIQPWIRIKPTPFPVIGTRWTVLTNEYNRPIEGYEGECDVIYLDENKVGALISYNKAIENYVPGPAYDVKDVDKNGKPFVVVLWEYKGAFTRSRRGGIDPGPAKRMLDDLNKLQATEPRSPSPAFQSFAVGLLCD